MKLVLKKRKPLARFTWALASLAIAAGVMTSACDDGDSDGPGGAGGSTAGAGGSSQSGGSPGSGGNNEGGEGGVSSSGGSDGSGGSSIEVATVQSLADHSSTDYGLNEHGIISGGRLKRWIDDWEGTRPAGVDGRLIIIQVVPPTVTTSVHITPNEAKGVFTYLINSNDFNVARDNGLSSFETDIPDGAAVDAWLKKYAIDPRKDFVVLTFEDQASTTNAIVQSVGRAWIFLKYWGFSKERLGILNGSLNWNSANHGLHISTAALQRFSKPKNDGTVTVRDLGIDATVQSISLEELIDIVKKKNAGDSSVAGVRIVDARGGPEAYGLKKATSTGRTDCESYASAVGKRCSTPFEGRIRHAKSVPWPQFIDTKANGFRFLPYAEVKELFDLQSGWDGNSTQTIQYCRTNQRSTVTGIVANVILGYPTRFYETSFIEWGYISAGPEDEEVPDGAAGATSTETFPKKSVVSASFPFRTDLHDDEALTEYYELTPEQEALYVPGSGNLPAGFVEDPSRWVLGPNYNDEQDIPLITSTWPPVNTSSTTTRLAIDTDRAYLRGISIEDLDD